MGPVFYKHGAPNGAVPKANPTRNSEEPVFPPQTLAATSIPMKKTAQPEKAAPYKNKLNCAVRLAHLRVNFNPD